MLVFSKSELITEQRLGAIRFAETGMIPVSNDLIAPVCPFAFQDGRRTPAVPLGVGVPSHPIGEASTTYSFPAPCVPLAELGCRATSGGSLSLSVLDLRHRSGPPCVPGWAVGPNCRERPVWAVAP